MWFSPFLFLLYPMVQTKCSYIYCLVGIWRMALATTNSKKIWMSENIIFGLIFDWPKVILWINFSSFSPISFCQTDWNIMCQKEVVRQMLLGAFQIIITNWISDFMYWDLAFVMTQVKLSYICQIFRFLMLEFEMSIYQYKVFKFWIPIFVKTNNIFLLVTQMIFSERKCLVMFSSSSKWFFHVETQFLLIVHWRNVVFLCTEELFHCVNFCL